MFPPLVQHCIILAKDNDSGIGFIISLPQGASLLAWE